MVQWCWQGKIKWDKKLSQHHSVHRESHMGWPETEARPLMWGPVTNHLSHGMTCEGCRSSVCKYRCIQQTYQPVNAVKGNNLFIVKILQIHKTYYLGMKSFRIFEQMAHWQGSRNVYLIQQYRKNYTTEICDSCRAFSGSGEPLKAQWEIIFVFQKATM